MATDSKRDKQDYRVLIPTDLAGRPRHLAPKQPTEIIANSPASTVPATSTIDVLELIPEEQVWLDGLKTANTRRAYQNDVAHFARVLGIASSEKLYAADHRAVTYWENNLREVERLEPSTIRRRLSALSSLFTHLVDHGVVKLNPVREIKRPELDRSEGKTLPFSRQEARKILDEPDASTLMGRRDRAILSIGFQVGLRREEIANLGVDSLHKNRGLDALWVKRKRKRNRQSVTINPQTASVGGVSLASQAQGQPAQPTGSITTGDLPGGQTIDINHDHPGKWYASSIEDDRFSALRTIRAEWSSFRGHEDRVTNIGPRERFFADLDAQDGDDDELTSFEPDELLDQMFVLP